MEQVSISSDWRDARWQADYQAALRELIAPPTRRLLPAPKPPVDVYDEDNPSDVVPLQLHMAARPLQLHPFSLPIVEHAFNPDSRDDVLSLVRIVKTPKPGLRAVFYDGVAIGKIGKNPYGMGWVASCSRSTLYWSVEEAALALVEDVAEASR